MKLNWKQTALIGLGMVFISLVWTPYNLFIPLFLQSGDPIFDALHKVSIPGFGLNAKFTGLVMTLDNVAAVLIVPLIGVWSDNTHTRLGRRLPFLLFSTPVVAVTFSLIPFTTLMIRPAFQGSISGNMGAFVLFIAAVGVMLVGMQFFRAPSRALLPDLTPSPLRSKANGIISFMGGTASVIASLWIAQSFDVQPWLPFVIVAVLLCVVTFALYFGLRRSVTETHDLPVEAEPKQPSIREMFANTFDLPKPHRSSLIKLLVAVFIFSIGYNAFETFYSSYAVAKLGVTAGQAARQFAIALIAFLVFAIPAGFIGERFGRRRSILAGLCIFTVPVLIVVLVPGLVINEIMLAAGGLAWALIEVNTLPMILDSAPDDSRSGFFAGLFYLTNQGAAIVSPIITGTIIDWMGRDYQALFIVTSTTFVIALIIMVFVRRGEARLTKTAPAK
ncbi:MAG: MFS transporter [Anaerolineae bacterium]|nr:MFS transporter [Anaerolineae bacterium]